MAFASALTNESTAGMGRLNERSLLLNNNEVRPNKEHAQGKEEKVQLHYE